MSYTWSTRPTTDSEVLACLQELPRLPKRHWSWTFDNRLLAQPELLREVIRILGAVPLPPPWVVSQLATWRREHARKLLTAARDAGVTDCMLKLSPWGGNWTNSAGENDPRLAAGDGVEGTPRGHEHIEAVGEQMTIVRDEVATLAAELEWPFQIAGVWIDQEAFQRRDDVPGWNEALRWCNDTILGVLRLFWPRATLVQHGRGTSRYYTERCAPTGNHCCPIYMLDQPDHCIAALKAAANRAAREGITAVYPVVSLGGRYVRRFHVAGGWWPGEIPVRHCWRIGSLLHDPYYGPKHFGPEIGSLGDQVLLWPEVLPGSVSTPGGPRACPDAGPQFVAYCLGALRHWLPKDHMWPEWIVDYET